MSNKVDPNDEGKKPVENNINVPANSAEASSLPPYMRKGVRRFKTYEDMNREDELIAHWRRTHSMTGS